MDHFGSGLLWAPSLLVRSAADPDVRLHIFSRATVGVGCNRYRLTLSGELEWCRVDDETYAADEGRLAPCRVFCGAVADLDDAPDEQSLIGAARAVLRPGDGLIGEPLADAHTEGLIAPLRAALPRLSAELADGSARVDSRFAEVRADDPSPALEAMWAALTGRGLRVPRDFRVEWPPEAALLAATCLALPDPDAVYPSLQRSPQRGAMVRWGATITREAAPTTSQRRALWDAATRCESVRVLTADGAGLPIPVRVEALRSHHVLATFGSRVYLLTIDGRLLGGRLDDRALAVREGRLFDLRIESPSGPHSAWPSDDDVERRVGYRASPDEAARLVGAAQADLETLRRSVTSGEADCTGAESRWPKHEGNSEVLKLAAAEATAALDEWTAETLAGLALDDIGAPAAACLLLADRRAETAADQAGEPEVVARVRWLAGRPRSRPQELVGAPPLARLPVDAHVSFKITDFRRMLDGNAERGERESEEPKRSDNDHLMIAPETSLLTLGRDRFLIASDGRLLGFSLDGKAFASKGDRLVFQGPPVEAPALGDEELLDVVRRHLRSLSLLIQQGEILISDAHVGRPGGAAERDDDRSTHNETEAWARAWLDATAAHLRVGGRPRAPRRDD